MNVGVVGLGKLGLPLALAIESRGQTLFGYDQSSAVRQYIRDRCIPYQEDEAQQLLKTTQLVLCDSIADLVAKVDILFVIVQTPHDAQFEGVTRLPDHREDFDYSYLEKALRSIADAQYEYASAVMVVIVSTALPGTLHRYSPIREVIYNPSFIAMGTAVQDFLHPEFILIGANDGTDTQLLKEMYRQLAIDAPILQVSVESAELIKVAYNSFIGLKLAFISTMQEICHRLGCAADVDDVTTAIQLATRRLISGQYLRAGMGDGGGCHPRDQIAMSSLARRLDLSSDIFEFTIQAREKHADWLVDLIEAEHKATGLPIRMLGRAYKPQSNITTGSAAVLVAHLLVERRILFASFDPHLDDQLDQREFFETPGIYFVATAHEEFAAIDIPPGSVVIDPWRYLPKREGVRYVRIGAASV